MKIMELCPVKTDAAAAETTTFTTSLRFVSPGVQQLQLSSQKRQ